MKGFRYWMDYLRHVARANTRHGTHSPFVYKLLDEVVYRDPGAGTSTEKDRTERLIGRLMARFKPENVLLVQAGDEGLPDSWPDNPGPSIVILYKGIYGNRKSKSGWRQLQQLPGVTVTIDLFQLGLAFYKTDQAPEHFRIRF